MTEKQLATPEASQSSDPSDEELLFVDDELVDDAEAVSAQDMMTVSNNHVNDYLRQIGRFDLLTTEDEQRLAKSIEVGLFASEKLEREADMLSDVEKRELAYLQSAGNRDKEVMINANLRLVVSIAKRYVHTGVELMDVIQFGNDGLVRAIERFDYQKGFKFSTYASWWIKQAIARGLVDESRTIDLPHDVVAKIKTVDNATQALMKTLGRVPTSTELAKSLEMSVSDVEQIQSDNQMQPISLQTPLGENGESVFGDLIEDTENKSPEDEAARSHLADDLALVLLELPEQQADIIRMKYGIGDGVVRSSTEIGKVFGKSRSQIDFILERAMRGLRLRATQAALYDYLEE